jgi:hypothetical protein
MKKTLLSALLGLFSVFAFAQASISVTLDKPALNDNVIAGTAFDYEITVTNNGSTAISGDTLINIITFDGSYIPTGPSTILGYYEIATIAPGATQTFTHSINLQGGPTGPVNVCAEVLENPSSTDTVKSCNMIFYSNPLSTGELSESKIQNNSFYANGTLNIDVINAFGQKDASVSVINVNGQTIAKKAMEVNDGVIDGAISLDNLASGIYIVNIEGSNGVIATQKIMKN